MTGFSSAIPIIFLCLAHAAQCHGLLTRRIQPAVVSVSSSGGCATSVCSRRTAPPRKGTEFTFLSRRSFQLDNNNSRIVAVVAAIVGVLAVCGILAILLWYRRRISATRSFKEEESTHWADFPPVSARYPAPSPEIYAERLASVERSTTSLASLTIPANAAPLAGNSKQTRVPPPRLSRLPSLSRLASPSIAKIRDALRSPRRQDSAQGLPRTPRPKPRPRLPVPPSPIIPKVSDTPSDLRAGRASDIPNELPLTLP